MILSIYNNFFCNIFIQFIFSRLLIIDCVLININGDWGLGIGDWAQ